MENKMLAKRVITVLEALEKHPKPLKFHKTRNSSKHLFQNKTIYQKAERTFCAYNMQCERYTQYRVFYNYFHCFHFDKRCENLGVFFPQKSLENIYR